MPEDRFEPGRRVKNSEWGEGEILGKCKHPDSWDVMFDNFPFWMCAREVDLELLPESSSVEDSPEMIAADTPSIAPTTFKWGQPVIVDGGTDNAREGIVICDEPSKTDRSWFVSLPNCCNQWIREDRLTAKPNIETPKVLPNLAEYYSGYGWIKVKRFIPEKYATIEERYTALELHHVQETLFLIDKVRELAAQVTPKTATDPAVSLGGQTVPLAEHQAAIELLEARKYEVDRFSECVSHFRVCCHQLSEEAKEAARYAYSCPEHTQSTLNTIAFRLDRLARGVESEKD